MRVNLGKVVATKGVAYEIDKDNDFKSEIIRCLDRYCVGDWGDTNEEDALLNNTAVEIGERILAAYETTMGRIWIITEYDRSVTTILFPSEY